MVAIKSTTAAAVKPPASDELRLLRAKRALLVSALFDAEFYRATYPDMRNPAIDPLTHYLTQGEAEGRSPNPVFAPRCYRRHWMAGLPAEQNALLHYIEEGERRGAQPHPAFDPAAYSRRTRRSPNLSTGRSFITWRSAAMPGCRLRRGRAARRWRAYWRRMAM